MADSAHALSLRAANDLPANDLPANDGPSDRGLAGAGAVARGIGRLLARNYIWTIPEMPLVGGRRADLMGLDSRGQVVIVEIKVSRADLIGDGKWTDYLDHCDRFYWGLSPDLDRRCLDSADFHPDRCGVIVADSYDAEILRPAPLLKLAAARRRAEVERLARCALRRRQVDGDPHCATWGGEFAAR